MVATGEVTRQQACEREPPAGAREGDPGNVVGEHHTTGSCRNHLNYSSPRLQ